MKILHFADAHIDMANYGRHDPVTGLPLRVLDFLKSLDTIVDTAIERRVDMVIFAGDAYKDRSPAPTFQREWGKRIMRLSQAKIPTLLLVGNHDISPSIGRAHALQEFKTLQVPYVKVLDAPELLTPAELWDVPLQVIAMPWVARSGLMATLDIIRRKILAPEQVANWVSLQRFLSKRIVFTNGCFDILHLGHVDYLARAVLGVGPSDGRGLGGQPGRWREFYPQKSPGDCGFVENVGVLCWEDGDGRAHAAEAGLLSAALGPTWRERIRSFLAARTADGADRC